MSTARRPLGISLALLAALALVAPAGSLAATGRAAVARRAPAHPVGLANGRPARVKVALAPTRAELRNRRPPIDGSLAARDEARGLHRTQEAWVKAAGKRARATGATTRAMAGRLDYIADNAADPHLAEVTAHSEVGGRYVVMSDLHMGRGRSRTTRSGWFRGEDFRQDDIFVDTLAKLRADPRPTTLVMNGDWIEMIRHADPQAGYPELRKLIEQNVRGHEREMSALARAIARGGVRLIFIQGNHDLQMVDPRLRDALTAALARAGRLTPGEAARLRERTAWAGPMVFLGRYAEGVISHGQWHDSINSTRSLVNPSVYRNGKREIQNSLGWQIVRALLGPADLVEAAMSEEDKAKSVLRYVRSQVRTRGAVNRMLRALFPFQRETSGERLASQLDDRAAWRAYVRRSGIVERSRFAPPGEDANPDSPATEHQWIRALERLNDSTPENIHDTLRSRLWPVNLYRGIAGFIRSLVDGERDDAELIDGLGKLGNVRYAVLGHTHTRKAVHRTHATKGTIEYVNSGTWSITPQGWRLDAVLFDTDADGRLIARGLHEAKPGGQLVEVEQVPAVGEPPGTFGRIANLFGRVRHAH